MDLLQKAPLEFELLRKNRFMLRFPADLGIQEWNLVSASRPKIDISVVEIPFLNTQTYVSGKYSWGEINVVLRDTIGPSTSQALMEWVRLCAESVSGRMGYAAGYKRDVELEMLDPNGVVVQKWIIVNAWISSFDGGDLTMSDAEVATDTITLRPDYCILAY